MTDAKKNSFLIPAASGAARPVCRALALVCAAGALAGLSGCETDSFMDPSVLGRWEHTPTVMPILERIASIEGQPADIVEYTEPTAEDLLPAPFVYRVGPGDNLRITLWDLIQTNTPETYEVAVDVQGFVELPQLGRVLLAGKTFEEAKVALEDAMKRFVSNPLATIVPLSQRQQIFNLVGVVDQPGPYFIPRIDYRLLEAITSGGRFDESIQEIYVVRQITLSEALRPRFGDGTAPSGGASSTTPGVGGTPAANPASGQDLINVIDDLTGGNTPPPAPAPGMMGSSRARPAAAQPVAPEPAIDLVNGQPVMPSAGSAAAASGIGETSWVFLNGQWVEVRGPRALAEQVATNPAAADQLITQRVIRIRLKELLAGKQSVNIVIRPGDVIRVPAPPTGFIYLGGQVARPGSYGLPPNGRLTLLRALDSAGGLTGIAVPERIDLQRMIGTDRQATIRLDGRAIAEQVQPDLFLKPDDRIVVGTNFWALPLAVFRNGFRASYGFGFILDRNFGNDVFGAPPENRGF